MAICLPKCRFLLQDLTLTKRYIESFESCQAPKAGEGKNYTFPVITDSGGGSIFWSLTTCGNHQRSSGRAFVECCIWAVQAGCRVPTTSWKTKHFYSEAGASLLWLYFYFLFLSLHFGFTETHVNSDFFFLMSSASMLLKCL